MWLAIIVGVVLLTAAIYGFWPHRRGVVDSDLKRSKKVTQGYAEYFRDKGPGR